MRYYYAQISAGRCVGVSDLSAPVESASMVPLESFDTSVIGKAYAGGVFSAPPAEPKAWQAFDFYRRFTTAERIAIRNLAQTDSIAADFMATLDATIASGARVVANDPDLLAGLGYLQTKPTGSPVLTAGRAAELLA